MNAHAQDTAMGEARVKPRVGVVTVLYQSDDVLADFFASLAAQAGVALRLYVIDNSATDSGSLMSRQLAEAAGLDAQVVFNDANLGGARAATTRASGSRSRRAAITCCWPTTTWRSTGPIRSPT